MPVSSPLTVSVIIPIHRGGKDFEQCLEAVAATTWHPHEIIIVADGGMAGTPYPDPSLQAVVIETRNRNGPARVRNVGAQKAIGDILFFFDADVAIRPETIRKVVETFSASPELAALIGSYDDRPAKSNFISQYRNLLHHHVHQTGREEASTFWSGCGAIRREIFLKMGGFDESCVDRIEDVDFGFRLKKAGHSIRLCKEIQVKHLKRWSAGSMLRTDFFQRAIPWTELIFREHRMPNDLNTDTTGRLSVVLIFMLLATLLAALWRPAFLKGTFFIAVFLASLNWPLYRFFQNQRGSWFALKVVPWHWLYFFYSGLAFGIGMVRFFVARND